MSKKKSSEVLLWETSAVPVSKDGGVKETKHTYLEH